MSKSLPKFNTALEVLEFLDNNELTPTEKQYYFAKLRASGGMEGVTVIDDKRKEPKEKVVY